MTGASKSIELLLASARNGDPAVIVRVAATQGSAPREEDAAMAVTAGSAGGTIGGGQLEWLAVAHARKILAGQSAAGTIDVALGPEIGQCCGGRVRLDFRIADSVAIDDLQSQLSEAGRRSPQVLVFGAGHTGRALAHALAPLPVQVTVIDERPETLRGLPETVATVATALPEAEVGKAAPGSAFVAMTHLHSLDFQIVAAVLERGDAAYCGMIGSKTKRAVFASWFSAEERSGDVGMLTCPIGGTAVRDKRPEVIAAMTTAEILQAIYSRLKTQASG